MGVFAALVGVGGEAVAAWFVFFVAGEGVAGDHFGEADAEHVADFGDSARDRGLAGAELRGDVLAWLAFQDAHAVDREVRQVGFLAHPAHGGFDLGPEDGHFVLGVGGRVISRDHPAFFEAQGLDGGVGVAGFGAAALLCAAAVEFVAQDVLGDGEQPGGEADASFGVEAVDGFGEGGEGFLGEIANGLLADAAAAPLGELGLHDGPEGLPELIPRGLVVGAEAVEEGGGDGAEHGGRV